MTQQGKLTLGIFGTSSKSNENRLPIHPDHFTRFSPELKSLIYVEKGYGEKFGVDEAYLKSHTAGVLSREELFQKCDVALLPKPSKGDFAFFKEGQILWGWVHCVQGPEVTQVGIDKKMTYITWEAMHKWNGDTWGGHTFYKNNELAGYCGVLDSLRNKGVAGMYGGENKRVAVIHFGSTARGAIYALQGQGYNDITVYTEAPAHEVPNQVPGVSYRNIKRVNDGRFDRAVVVTPEGETAFSNELAGYDVIVNCILQDTNRPLMYIQGDELKKLKPRSHILDISCDEGLGFDFAKPTSFENPMFEVGAGITYYAVDHTPSYLWNAATAEISSALLPHIETVLSGEQSWNESATIRKAIEIKNGEILNKDILNYQNRSPEYPHDVIEKQLRTA